MHEALSSGSWVTARRVRLVSGLMLAISVVLFAQLILTGSGTLDATGRPIGTDFSNVWSAGWMANHGQAALAWDWEAHRAAQQQLHGSPEVPFFPWSYPPPFLLIAAPLAQLPYLAALLVWLAATLAAALLVVRKVVPGKLALLAAAGFPAVFVCLGHGQNGLFTAALLGGGLLLLERRPLLAGVLIGCLCYKPQFALILPVFLLAGRNWRAIAGASLAVLALSGLTLAIWGWPVWQAFLDSLPATRTVIIEQGGAGWDKVASPFAAVRMWGGSVAAGWAVQALASLGAIAAVAFLTLRGNASLAAAGVMAAVLLSTPYVLDYDLVVLGMAMAFVVHDIQARGGLRWDISVLALCWAVPLVGRAIAGATLIPLNLIAVLAVLAVALRRAAAKPLQFPAG